jgi:SAM-dependent methyltransferase
MSKIYSGNIFDRLSGLENVLNQCQDSKVLDVGCAQGLVSYEFAKYGASLIHGVDINESFLDFAEMLFSEVPIESKFVRCDLAIGSKSFIQKVEPLNKYDIVLYLGIYHHLMKQTSKDIVLDLLGFLLNICEDFFIVRTDLVGEIHQFIYDHGFELYSYDNWNENVGELRIYHGCK